jgi:anthranilate phosphoribosyltransferase
MIIDPQKLGLTKPKIKDIQVTTKDEAVNAFVSVLNNSANKAMIEITALNAAGGLVVANVANDFKSGLEIALDTIKSGMSYSLFEDFVRYCGNVKKLKELE